MSIASTVEDEKRRSEMLQQRPGVQIFLQPIAPPAALGLAGFAGSTWITASYIANWWGNAESPSIFFPFVGIFGGLAQFIAGLYGFRARDTLVTVINTMWGSFWISIGILYAFVAAGALRPHEVHTHFPELASWFVILCVFTWSCALAATARDIVLTACLTSLAIGSTIACCLFAYNGGRGSASGDGLHGGVTRGIKAASYFWMFSALMAWWRVTVYLVEEAYGPGHTITKFFPIGRTPMEKRAPYIIPGLGEPGVKRGVPKPLGV
ncbi:GPR1/FUN34/yaaH family-domain-containing protein [Apiospora arundinis]|uniref:Carboxylic ester hydrolase n=1 Tax=Apiospora arundinis TaxID=335852 RepID=A0ABR2HS39_9PEZI